MTKTCYVMEVFTLQKGHIHSHPKQSRRLSRDLKVTNLDPLLFPILVLNSYIPTTQTINFNLFVFVDIQSIMYKLLSHSPYIDQ